MVTTAGNDENQHTGTEAGTFFFSFMGEHVEVCGSFFHSTEEIAIKVQGYLLDMDDTYMFLGDHPDEISNAIKIDKVVWIQVIPESNVYTQILDTMDIPDGEDKKN